MVKHFHFGDFSESEGAAVLELKLSVFDPADRLDFFIVVIDKAPKFHLTEPITLSHVLLLLEEHRGSDLYLPDLSQRNIVIHVDV